MRRFSFIGAMSMTASTVLLAALLASSLVQAHMALVDPVPRTSRTGQTLSPCGREPAGESVATYTAGTDIEITINLEILHVQSTQAAISFDNFTTRTELARIRTNESGIYKMTVPLPMQPLGSAVLQVTHGNYVSCADITLSEGEGALFTINAGINDAWVSADAPLQGLFFTVFPDTGFFFLSWFTFDSVLPDPGVPPAVFGASDQRWMTGGNFYSGNSVTLNAELTSGGIFNGSDPTASQQPGYGTITIVFNSCSEAVLSYNFPSVGLSGEMTLTRALLDNILLCEMLNNS